MEFFERLMPDSGLICIARQLTKGYEHTFFAELYDAVDFLDLMDSRGHTMYLAQSSYSSIVVPNKEWNKTHKGDERRKERSGANVEAVRSFWFDVDAGPEKFALSPDKSYPTQTDAMLAIHQFCSETGLPTPTIVNSGNGLYTHWFLDRDVSGNEWHVSAELLKGVAAAYGFKADPARSSDRASVLRPPGTHNRKHGQIKQVKVCGELTDPINFEQFHNTLVHLAKGVKISLKATLPPEAVDMYAQFKIANAHDPVSAHTVANKCAQMKYFRDNLGNVDEPVWYNAIGVIKNTIEGSDLIHEWSAGHPDYTPEATDSKISHWNGGPPSCATFSSCNPSGCLGCKHKDKISNPLALGVTAPVQVALAPGRILPPDGYTISPDGIWVTNGDIDEKIYGYEFYPVSVAMDHSLGYETVLFRHHLPHDGWRDFSMRAATVQDATACLMTLHDNHVQVIGVKEKKAMLLYAESYMDKVRNSQKLGQLYSQMGWHEDGTDLSFILGSKVFTPGGEETAGLARNIPEVAKSITAVGSQQEWADATQILGTPGMEPLAFALMAGAFGAPLLRFTGFSGALLSMIGPSGAGKTLMGYWVLSAYGEPAKLVVLRDDTKNMMIARLGLYGTLPLYIDEITNIDPMDLSDLVYKITQGRDKGRLNKNSVERANINQWNTIAVTSSNSSLIDKLGFAKSDATAEINRVFEYRVPPMPQLTKPIATEIYRTVTTNYGGIGQTYVKYLVDNADKHTACIDRLAAQIDKMVGARSDERFWSAIAASSIYGGMIAKSLGLVQFEVSPVMSWMVDTIKGMREVKKDYVADPVSLIGQFLDRHASGIIVVNNTNQRNCSLLREPHGAIVARLELDTMRLFLSRDVLRRDLFKSFGSYDLIKHELTAAGALIRHDMRKNLGAGTFLSGVQQACWELDLTKPILGHVKMSLVTGAPGLHVVAS